MCISFVVSVNHSFFDFRCGFFSHFVSLYVSHLFRLNNKPSFSSSSWRLLVIIIVFLHSFPLLPLFSCFPLFSFSFCTFLLPLPLLLPLSSSGFLLLCSSFLHILLSPLFCSLFSASLFLFFSFLLFSCFILPVLLSVSAHPEPLSLPFHSLPLSPPSSCSFAVLLSLFLLIFSVSHSPGSRPRCDREVRALILLVRETNCVKRPKRTRESCCT